MLTLRKSTFPRRSFSRLPRDLQRQLGDRNTPQTSRSTLSVDTVHVGDARTLLRQIASGTVALSVWSPPYYVGKSYESDLTFDEWKRLLAEVIQLHGPILKPGGFLAVNIADILCFRDSSMPKIQGRECPAPSIACQSRRRFEGSISTSRDESVPTC